MHRLLFLTVAAIVSALGPALADDERDCLQQKEPQLRIKACSEIIQRDPNDATAYHNRAVAYGLAGNLERAIADYTKAIEIRPDNASAYENRGRAYASKGDYTRALADVMKASELVAKAATGSTSIKQNSPKATVTTPKKPAAIRKPKAYPQSSSNAAKKAPQDDLPARASVLENSTQ
jgi:tetratricopeptide (TPR) repeat protein